MLELSIVRSECFLIQSKFQYALVHKVRKSDEASTAFLLFGRSSFSISPEMYHVFFSNTSSVTIVRSIGLGRVLFQ